LLNIRYDRDRSAEDPSTFTATVIAGRKSHYMPDEITPVPPVAPVAVPPVPPVAPIAAPPAEDPGWLAERLERHGRKILSDALGVKTAEEAKAIKQKLEAAEKKEKEAEEAKLSEIDRLKKIGDEAMTRANAAEARAVELERKAKVDALLHSKGVKNLDYAHFLLDKGRGDSADFDYDKALSDAMGDPLTKTALGFVEATGEPVPPKAAPGNTSPAIPGQAPKPPTSTNVPAKTMKDATKEEWLAYRKSMGII